MMKYPKFGYSVLLENLSNRSDFLIIKFFYSFYSKNAQSIFIRNVKKKVSCLCQIRASSVGR